MQNFRYFSYNFRSDISYNAYLFKSVQYSELKSPCVSAASRRANIACREKRATIMEDIYKLLILIGNLS